MNPNDEKPLLALVTDVLAYYRQPVSEFTLSVWWSAMQPYTLEQVRKALTAHATNPDGGQFAPKVADVVRILDGTHTDRAVIAWGKLHEAMSAVGAYQDVVFDDPAIHAAIDDLGGWPKVCRTETRELSFLQKRFCDAHKAYTNRGKFDYPRRLMGDRSPDDEYTRHGLPAPSPALVGDRQLAAMVYQNGGIGGKTAIEYTDPASLALTNTVIRRIAA
jgi:hypothetical protein